MERDPADIDPDHLDRELIGQPQLTRATGHREAEAKHAHDQAKARMAVLDARLSLAIRANPTKYGLREKPNKEEVEAAVLTQPAMEAAQKEVLETKYALDIASADTTWVLDRRKMLERLVDLLALDYYSEREPRPKSVRGREQADEVRRRAAEGSAAGELD